MTNIIRAKGTAKRERTKKIATTDGRGFSWIADGFDVADIGVEIDVDYIVQQLGEQAIGNKSTRSKALNGAIVVQAYNVRRQS